MKKIKLWYVLTIPVLLAIVFVARFWIGTRSFMLDFSQFYWPESRIFWSRENPLEVHGDFPWVYTLYAFYVMPWFPLNIAKICGFAILLVSLMFTGYISGRTIEESADISHRRALILGILIAFTIYPWASSVSWGNIGTLTCVAARLSLHACKARKEILAGVFLAVALIKPHATALIIVPMLLTRHISAVAIGGVLVLSSGLFASAWLGETPWNMLQMLFSNAGSGEFDFVSAGIMSFLLDFGIDNKTVFILSAIAGIAYCIYFTLKLYSEKTADIFTLSIPSVIALTFWFYKNGQDEYLLLIPVLMFSLLIWKRSGKFECNIPEASIFLILCMGTCGLTRISCQILTVAGFGGEPVQWTLDSIWHLVIAVIGVYIVGRMVKER